MLTKHWMNKSTIKAKRLPSVLRGADFSQLFMLHLNIILSSALLFLKTPSFKEKTGSGKRESLSFVLNEKLEMFLPCSLLWKMNNKRHYVL